MLLSMVALLVTQPLPGDRWCYRYG